MGGDPNQPVDGPDRTLGYQSTRHVPRHHRIKAAVTAFTGVVSTCLSAGLGFAGGAAFLEDSNVIVAAVCGILALCFLASAWILFRQANEQWGWVG